MCKVYLFSFFSLYQKAIESLEECLCNANQCVRKLRPRPAPSLDEDVIKQSYTRRERKLLGGAYQLAYNQAHNHKCRSIIYQALVLHPCRLLCFMTIECKWPPPESLPANIETPQFNWELENTARAKTLYISCLLPFFNHGSLTLQIMQHNRPGFGTLGLPRREFQVFFSLRGKYLFTQPHMKEQHKFVLTNLQCF